MKKTFFLSDVHLGGEKPEKETSKLAKLDRLFKIVAEEGDELYIIGDLFDYWFDYSHIIFSDYFLILHMMRKLTEAGIKITFFGGNHDWWVNNDGFLAKSIKIEVHKEHITKKIADKSFFIGHGDGIAPSDWGYSNLLKPVLRNPVSIFLYRLVPINLSYAIARFVSSGSKLYTTSRKLQFEREYVEFARQKSLEGIDFVVLGHVHTPYIEKFEKGCYVNTGNFFMDFTFAVFDGNEMKIESII